MKRSLILLTILIAIGLQPATAARPKLYYYDGDIPMVEMMLNMMAVMGMIDKVPYGWLRSGGPGYPNNQYGFHNRRWNNRWGNLPGPGTHSGNFPGSYLNSAYGHSRYGNNVYNLNCGGGPCADQAAFDGVWISSTREMLGIKRNRIIWSDGKDNHVAGVFSVTPGFLSVRMDNSMAAQTYQYSLEGNQLNIRDSDGFVRRFYRLEGSNYY